MYTLAEFAKLHQNPLEKAVIQTLAMKSPVLELLPFAQVAGNAYSFNREASLPNVSFRAYNTNYPESTGTVQQVTETLRLFGTEAEIDRAQLLVAGAGGSNLISEETIRQGKAVAVKFDTAFFHGDSSQDSNSFNGLKTRLVNDQSIDCGADLTLSALDSLIDSVVGLPSALYMGKKMRRKVNDLCRAAGQAVETVNGTFGQRLDMYGNVPIYIVENAEGGDLFTDEIYACRFGIREFTTGLQCFEPKAYDQGFVGNFRVIALEWLASFTLYHGKSAAVLHSIGTPAVEEPVTP